MFRPGENFILRFLICSKKYDNYLSDQFGYFLLLWQKQGVPLLSKKVLDNPTIKVVSEGNNIYNVKKYWNCQEMCSHRIPKI